MDRAHLLPFLGVLLALFACGGESTTTPPATSRAATPSAASVPGATVVEHVDAAAAAALLAKDTTVTVLDVRTPTEYAQGHLQGAINVDFNAPDFAAQLEKLDRAKPYLLHCRSGGRSTKELDTLQKLRFASIYHLDGGVQAWTQAGNKLVQ